MPMYQWNVSLDGKHLFRTDWYEDEQASRIRVELKRAFGPLSGVGYAIQETKRMTDLAVREMDLR